MGAERDVERDWSGDYKPKLKARIVSDSEGSLRGDGSSLHAGDDHFANLGVRPIEPDWLTVEEMAVIGATQARARRYF